MSESNDNTDGNYNAFARIDWPVRTRRLQIRPATVADVEAVWGWRKLPEVSRWITGAPGRDDFVAQFSELSYLARTLIVELDGQPIGDLMLRVTDAWAQTEVADQARGVQAELGWIFDPAQQGHGYATEAVIALVELTFGALNIRRLEASCFAANEPSWRLMERIGMRRELYSVAESLHRDGTWMDGMTYALLATEWPTPQVAG